MIQLFVFWLPYLATGAGILVALYCATQVARIIHYNEGECLCCSDPESITWHKSVAFWGAGCALTSGAVAGALPQLDSTGSTTTIAFCVVFVILALASMVRALLSLIKIMFLGV